MEREDMDRLNICGTCAGQGSHYAFIPCICDNKGTADAELDGLRRECIRLRAQIAAVEEVLIARGCSCPCDHDPESHTADCERCEMCLVQEALGGGPTYGT